MTPEPDNVFASPSGQDDSYQELLAFAAEMRNMRHQLIRVFFDNIQSELGAEINKDLPSSRKLIRDKLIKDVELDPKQANDLAGQLTEDFIMYLANALGRMQSARLETQSQVCDDAASN